MDDFVVTGERPPSVAGIRNSTASTKDFGYYTKHSQSFADETLFQSHHTSSLNMPVTFSAPWNKKLKEKDGVPKKTNPGRPLLWAPAASSDTKFHLNKSATTPTKDSVDDSYTPKMSGTICSIPLKHQYRRLKHTPTYVDESLFGEQLMEPTFKAPWEGKKKAKQILNWYPENTEGRKPVRRSRRPATALGLRGYSVSANAVPVWKP